MKFEKLINSFKKLNYKEYYLEHKLNEKLDFDYHKQKNHKIDPNFIFNNNNKNPYLPDLEDIIRLHFFTTMRNITTILELGVGYSTIAMADALSINKKKIDQKIIKKIRRDNLFEIHTVDTDKKYIEITKKKLKKNHFVNFNYSKASTVLFNGRVCARFNKLPNVTPDLIYVDGPCFMHVQGSVFGINMRHKDRTLVSCDILSIEHLLIPGTIIIWDGQKNNVNFFKKNSIRNWKIYEDRKIFIAELNEKSLGIYNDEHLKLLNG